MSKKNKAWIINIGLFIRGEKTALTIVKIGEFIFLKKILTKGEIVLKFLLFLPPILIVNGEEKKPFSYHTVNKQVRN